MSYTPNNTHTPTVTTTTTITTTTTPPTPLPVFSKVIDLLSTLPWMYSALVILIMGMFFSEHCTDSFSPACCVVVFADVAKLPENGKKYVVNSWQNQQHDRYLTNDISSAFFATNFSKFNLNFIVFFFLMVQMTVR